MVGGFIPVSDCVGAVDAVHGEQEALCMYVVYGEAVDGHGRRGDEVGWMGVDGEAAGGKGGGEGRQVLLGSK